AAAFTLFHRGDLAIDPGYDGESIRDWQFFRRTIAHNTIVVDAPGAGGELTDHPWGFEGGQRVPILTDRPRNVDQYFRLRNPEYPAESLFETGSVVAFETSDRFDYAAVDATRAYERAQLTAFVRHLVFIKPDLVLVYDVIHTPPGRSPRWLLQSVHPPHLSQRSFSVANGGGVLEAAVLLPVAARVTGLPTPAGHRTEVAGEPAAEHRFLVVIRAGERGAVAPVVARAERVSDALIVQVEPSGPDHPGAGVTFRWNGQPGVEVRLGG
ncbi:MAG TPA: heparinase II/III family protein, partial [Limnochordia bacterium]